ncbi:hypothetical protein GCM10022419_033690 [Nonomuraea rosea]|uniref:Uncharacterized protein n=1 Tax=Nonomuraea rosea TaxID=638574 RepID=A0ABP6WGU8_9ACTN
MDDLIAFLHARLGNDRERAPFLRTLAALQPPDMKRELEDMADWIERDIAAKLRIVATYTEVDAHPNRLVYAFMQQQWVALRAVMVGLALPYADHEDYREEWKP